MANMTVKDSNGKDFTFDIAKVCDINGDANTEVSSIQDAKRNRVSVVHDVKYIDNAGKAIDSLQLLNDMKSGKTNVVALDVNIEATHSGKNHNHCVYYEDSMEKDSESFLNPFQKPMLKNHDSYSEPLGRIKQSTFGPSQLTDERSAIFLNVRVTDQEAMPKFIDGRYGTVSIGGSMGTVTCNVCGKTILKDGKFSFCGHWKGETYKDQVCYWGARDIDYNEVSVVNNPADDYAQVMQVKVITDEDLKKENQDNKKGAEDNMADITKKTEDATATDRDQLVNLIDKLLGEAAVKDAVQTPEGKVGDPVVPVADAKTDKTVEDMQKDLDEANKKVTDLTQELETEKTKVIDAVAAKESAEKDASTFKDQCVELAIANKGLIADKVIELEKVGGKLEDAKVEARKQELIGLSMKDLTVTLEASKIVDAQPRTPVAPVVNPTMASGGEKNSTIVDNDGNPVAKDSTTEEKAKDSNKSTSIDDIANNIISKLKR